MFEIIWQVFLGILNILLCGFSNWRKIIVDDVSNSIRISNSIFPWEIILGKEDVIIAIRLKMLFIIIFFNTIILFVSKGLITGSYDFYISSEVQFFLRILLFDEVREKLIFHWNWFLQSSHYPRFIQVTSRFFKWCKNA